MYRLTHRILSLSFAVGWRLGHQTCWGGRRGSDSRDWRWTTAIEPSGKSMKSKYDVAMLGWLMKWQKVGWSEPMQLWLQSLTNHQWRLFSVHQSRPLVFKSSIHSPTPTCQRHVASSMQMFCSFLNSFDPNKKLIPLIIEKDSIPAECWQKCAKIHGVGAGARP